MDSHPQQEREAHAPAGGVLLTASGFCAICDSYFVDAAAYRFEAPDGTVLVEARHYPATR